MLDVRRLVVAVRGNTVYHYWRDCKMVDKWGLFQVQETVKDGTYNITGAYMIYKKKRISDWNDVMDIIEALQIEKLREKKLSRLLDDK
jgi:hypothetical protein